MSLYKASVTYGEESINAFAKAQFSIFQRKTKIIMLAAATLLLLLGAFDVGGRAVSIILLFAGCLLIVNIGNIPRRTAKAMMKSSSLLDTADYDFGGRAFTVTSGGASGRVEYKNLIRLAEDSKYYYLFCSSRVGYMLAKQSLAPNEPGGFRELLSSKSGCKWSGTGAALSTNLPTLIKKFKNRQK